MFTTEAPRFFAHELRVIDGPNGKPRIEGYAAVFNSLSLDLGGFREKIAPGAFADALRTNSDEDDTLAVMHHDMRMILGRRSAGTLDLREDEKGLCCIIDPPENTTGNDALVSIRRKDIKGMSFRFADAKDTWEKRDGGPLRTLVRIGRLIEVTLTGTPAYVGTSVSLRSALGESDETRSYYAAKIKELATPPGTPRLDMAERMYRLI